MVQPLKHARINISKLMATTCLSGLLFMVQPIAVLANPTDGIVSAGQATILSVDKKVTINQQTQKAVIDWRSFDLAPDEITEFNQPSNSALILNRVNSGGASNIEGKIKANGNVVIVNQNGIIFGAGSHVDVNGLVATTADIDNTKFMQDTAPKFNKAGNPNAVIINQGIITAKDAGLVGLVAPQIVNNGVIKAKMGKVQLSSGDKVTLDLYGDGLLEIGVSDQIQQQLVKNTGTIEADGGTIALTAASGRNIIDSLVQVEGNLTARTKQHKMGKVLVAGNATKGDVHIDSGIDVSGHGANQKGGAAHILGHNIALMKDTVINASGTLGGGEVLVGGDYKGGLYRGLLAKPDITTQAATWGKTPGGYSAANGTDVADFFATYYNGITVPHASRVYVDKNAVINAQSTAGNGGRAIFWSDNGTAFYGHANVSAHGLTGHGGFIEVSGRDWLDFGGTVNAAAQHGATGMLLLDPADITISNAANTAISASTPFQSTGAATSILNISTLQTALNGAANVIITSAAGTAGNGDITFADALAWNSIRTLTITASRHIVVNNSIINAGTGSITLNANVAITGDALINSNISTGGSITVLARRDITLATGATLTTGAAGALSLTAGNNTTAGIGNLNLNGNLSLGTGALTLLSGINGTRPNKTLNNTNLVRQGLTFGTVSMTGFQDLTIDRDINSSGNITIGTFRDLTLNAARTLTTGAAGALSLTASNALITSIGNLNLNGNLSAGTGALTLLSGINGTRPSLALNSINLIGQGTTFGTISITGFQDLVIDRDINSNGSITMLANRDLTLNATRTLTTSVTGALSLRAANGVTTNPGNLTLSGNLSLGTGALTLLSGINGTRPSWTATSINLVRQGATFGAIGITGFQDLVIDRDINSSGNIAIGSFRDLTLNATRTLTTGAAGTLTLAAANSAVAGTGNLNLNGNLSVGTGFVTLISGINVTRPNFTITATNFFRQGATFGAVSMTGFQDLIIDRDINSSGNITLNSFRDLTLNTTRTLTTGAVSALDLRAANAVATATGNLNINGNLSVGTGFLTLISGINGTRPTFVANTTTLTRQGTTFGIVNIQGFNNFTVDRPLNSTGTVNFSSNTLITLSDDVSSIGTMTFANAVIVDAGVTTNLTSTGTLAFNSTINGTAGGAAENVIINSATATTTFGGIVGGATALGNLSVTADNVTISSNLNGTGTLTLAPSTATRAVNIGTTALDNLASAGFNLSNNEMGRLVNGWGSLVIGSASTGDFTNSRPSFTDPITFLTGNDFINATAISSTDPILVRAVRDVIINQNIVTTNTTANALTLVAGRNLINNRGAGALSVGAGGRWLVYSTNPANSTGEENLANAFNRYSCVYGGACPTLGTGNGLLYSYTPMLTTTIANPNYKFGDAVGTPTGYIITSGDYLNALDSSSGIITGSAIFQTTYTQGANATTAYTVSNNGSTLASNLGYGFNFVTANGVVATRAITITANNQNKIYGFGSLDNNAYTITSGSLYDTNTISGINLVTNATTSTSGQYNYSATPWNIAASNAVFSSGLASNYTVSYVGGALTVGQRVLAISAVGVNKVYDGLTTASVNYADDRVMGDVLSASGTALFADQHAGVGKAINVSSIGISGADAANYSNNTTTTASADITARNLTVTANNQSITYGAGNSFNGFSAAGLQNGETIGSVSLTTNASTSTSGNWSYSTTPWAITASNATGGTFDINDYAVSYVSGALTVGQRVLAISAVGVNKVYDGLTTASVNYADDRVMGDVLSASGTALFADQHAGVGKAINVSSIGISGADAANYSNNTTTTASADITARNLTVTANNQSITYGANDPTFSYIYSGLASTDNATVFSGALERALGQNVGVYNIGLGALNAGANYNINYIGANLTINKAILNITANNASRQQNIANPIFTANYNGFKYVDDLSVVTGLSFTTPATINSQPGSYTVTPHSAIAVNYSFAYTNGLLLVELVPINIIPATVQAVLQHNIIIPIIGFSGFNSKLGQIAAPQYHTIYNTNSGQNDPTTHLAEKENIKASANDSKMSLAAPEYNMTEYSDVLFNDGLLEAVPIIRKKFRLNIVSTEL